MDVCGERTDCDRTECSSQWLPGNAKESVRLGSLPKAGRQGGRWDVSSFDVSLSLQQGPERTASYCEVADVPGPSLAIDEDKVWLYSPEAGWWTAWTSSPSFLMALLLSDWSLESMGPWGPGLRMVELEPS